MKHILLRFFFPFFILIALKATAQLTYRIDQSIPVEENGRMLRMPWSGGLNAAQFNTMDLNGDQKQDLVVFEHSSNKALTFINENNRYVYHPEFESLLPNGLTRWMLLRDLNCDGKKDLFTNDPLGIRAFINTTQQGSNLSWRPFSSGNALLTKGSTSDINIKMNTNDLPAIDDIDGDGDLDILKVKFNGPPNEVEWHRNMSIERGGGCDSLQFERVRSPAAWGGFEECHCGVFAFGEECIHSIAGKVSHVGGKALLTSDLDNDGDRDLLFSEEDCSGVFMLENKGNSTQAMMDESFPFPLSDPIRLPPFPASFLEDVDFDGLPDLLASPNIYSRFSSFFQESVWFYKNIGSPQMPKFTRIRKDFLQHEMIEVGTNAYPAFIDYDGDGDNDMFIGNYGGARLISTLSQYENIGTASEPAFRLITNDFSNLSRYRYSTIKPQFVDINGDRKVDLVFVASQFGAQVTTTQLYFIAGKSTDKLDISSEDTAQQNISSISFPLNLYESVLVVDVNRDQSMDLLVSRTTGALEYWKNTGSAEAFNYIKENNEFMGLGVSTSIGSIGISVLDMDFDGEEDLVIGNQLGHISIYKKFRNASEPYTATTNIIYDAFKEDHVNKNMGGQIQPTAVNLFKTNKPAIVVGTIMGGVMVLKNESGIPLAEDPAITLYPNPVMSNERISIRLNQNALMQIFSITGKELSLPVSITAHQIYSMEMKSFAAGIYVARFIVKGETHSQNFIVIN